MPSTPISSAMIKMILGGPSFALSVTAKQHKIAKTDKAKIADRTKIELFKVGEFICFCFANIGQ